MFFSIKNWVSSAVTPIEKPWEYRETSVPEDIRTKAQWTEWCKQFGTQHCFISAVEGATPELRVSEGETDGNPPVSCHGVLVDYDAAFDGETIARMKSKPKAEFLPSWIAETFSGHARLVWEFEKPVSIVSVAEYKAFMNIVAKRLGLKSWMAGWESDALADLHKYYEVGRNWQPMWQNSKVPASHVCLWMFEADQMVQLVPNQYEVPIEEVEKKVHEQYPGRWKGSFQIGSRGVRFWAPEADNPTGAQVTRDGMRVYTDHDGGFRSWKSLFGAAFVEKFQADRVASVLEKFVFETERGQYWELTDSNQGQLWTPKNETQIVRSLRRMGFDNRPGKKGGLSEAEDALDQIQTKSQVTAAMPFVHHPYGVIRPNCLRNTLMLNTATARALAPAPANTIPFELLPTEGFPHIFSFLSQFFERLETEHSRHVQLEYYLAWLKHAYAHALAQDPQPGMALVIAGEVAKGKTFHLEQILDPLLGGDGNGNAKDVWILGSPFNADLLKSPINYLDDAGTISPEARHRMTAAIKARVADPKVRYNQKYRTEGAVTWLGRVVLNLNVDAFSMSMLPTQDQSNGDKLLMLMTNSDTKFQFDHNRSVNNAWAAKELPFFARWLLDWKTPEHTIRSSKDPRFYIKPFKHPELHQTSAQSGASYPVCELILKYLDHYRKSTNAEPTGYWEGSASDMLQEINEIYPALMRQVDVMRLGSALGRLKASCQGDCVITNPKHHKGINIWKIPLAIAMGASEEAVYKPGVLKKPQGEKRESDTVQAVAPTHGPEVESASGGPVVDAAAGIFGLAPKSA